MMWGCEGCARDADRPETLPVDVDREQRALQKSECLQNHFHKRSFRSATDHQPTLIQSSGLDFEPN
jgi:hypothetical protein